MRWAWRCSGTAQSGRSPCTARGIQSGPMPVVGRNVPHDSARGHVTGQSLYVDDIAPAAGELLVDFLWSPFARARIRTLDIGPALKVDGVAGAWTFRDL